MKSVIWSQGTRQYLLGPASRLGDPGSTTGFRNTPTHPQMAPVQEPQELPTISRHKVAAKLVGAVLQSSVPRVPTRRCPGGVPHGGSRRRGAVLGFLGSASWTWEHKGFTQGSRGDLAFPAGLHEASVALEMRRAKHLIVRTKRVAMSDPIVQGPVRWSVCMAAIPGWWSVSGGAQYC